MPSFDHGVGDPVDGDIEVTPVHRVVLAEGNYLLLGEGQGLGPYGGCVLFPPLLQRLLGEGEGLRGCVLQRRLGVGAPGQDGE